MQLEELYYTSQIVAALAIILSIAFLAMEVRRNTNESRRRNVEEATSHRNDFIRMIASDEMLARTVGAALAGTRGSSTAWFRFVMFLYAIFVEFELNLRLFKSGQMDGELWNAWLEGYRWWLQFPGVRTWWSTRPAGFTQEFRQFVDNEIAAVAAVDEKLIAMFKKIPTDANPASQGG